MADSAVVPLAESPPWGLSVLSIIVLPKFGEDWDQPEKHWYHCKIKDTFAFFYSSFLVSLLGDFPSVSLLWTRQKSREALQLLTFFLSSWSDFERHGSCDCLLLRLALVVICLDSNSKMCKYVVVFPRGPRLRIWPLVFPGILEARACPWSHSGHCG